MLVEATPGFGAPEMSQEEQFRRSRRDLYRLRGLLEGESVIDLSDFAVPDRKAIDEHLRLCEYDTDNPMDLALLRGLWADALSYLRELHGYDFPHALEEPTSIHDAFLLAVEGSGRGKQLAIMALKVLHILNHIAGQQVVHTAAVPEIELVNRLNTKVLRVVDSMRADGVEIIEWAAGKKTRASLLTKLLAKRETLAGRIFDRLRYRIVTRSRVDLVRALIELGRRLVPFNYVIPGQSQNGILSADDVAAALSLKPEYVASVLCASTFEKAPTPQNEFSGVSYRCVNFVADIPIRIDDLVNTPSIAFVQAEFQLVDEATNDNNNVGENSHDAYKQRQLQKVKARLESTFSS